ncbi:MAG: alpha-ketoglutarate-dependent dioxygenase AlkB [Gammaproteobacteria bacterium]|nr:alpha-ketoglutarate-dependent dioxygenase AlkB [Gammaproteobacteria bacterium]
MPHQLEFQLPPEESALSVPSDQLELLRQGEADYRTNFITEEEEGNLIEAINQQNWDSSLQRRVQHYGYRYDYKMRKTTTDEKIGELPDWVSFLCDRLVAHNIFEVHPQQLIVNEYEPGQGIAPHADRGCFGPVVASISIGSNCMMDIYCKPMLRTESFQIVLERCSLLVLSGQSRYHWLHGIHPGKTDLQNGRKIPRSRRLSLTFRTMVNP